MTISNFTMAGYCHFYRSLLRFGRGINAEQAEELTYRLYTAVLDAYRHKKPDKHIEELTADVFIGNLKSMVRRPYRTIVQFYRSAETIALAMIPFTDDSLLTHMDAYLRLAGIMSNVEMRFDMAFDAEIDGPQSVYNICVSRLVPRRDEPGVCMMDDWVSAAGA